MKIRLLLALALVVWAGAAHAQTAEVVASCGSITIPAGGPWRLYQDTTGKLCTSSAGGGAGDASAANQASQITQETATAAALGVKTDAKSTATDGTSVSVVSVLKQISASIQAAASSLAGTLTVATHAVTQSGTWTAQPGNTPNTTPWLFTPAPTAGQGCTAYHLANGSAASTNSTNIKASAGTLCDITPINTTVTLYYLKMYNSASAPTCSSATNLVHIYPVPPAGAAGGAGGVVRSLPMGEAYSNGIGFCLTTSGADTSNDSAATGVYVEASYK